MTSLIDSLTHIVTWTPAKNPVANQYIPHNIDEGACFVVIYLYVEYNTQQKGKNSMHQVIGIGEEKRIRCFEDEMLTTWKKVS